MLHQGKSMNSQTVIDHLAQTGKITVGGAATGGTTYLAISNMDISQATTIAALVASVMTAIYFAVSAAYAIWKWRKEASGR